MFVKPKLVIGAILVSGVTISTNAVIPNNKNRKRSNSKHTEKPQDRKKIYKNTENKSEQPDSVQSYITCFSVVIDDTPSEKEPFIIVEDMPIFPGGNDEMFKFIDKQLIYPSSAMKNKIEGMVVCNFIVEIDGSISDITVVRSISDELDKEAIRIIKSFPKWIPGKQGGKAVKVKFTLPIKFTLPNK